MLKLIIYHSGNSGEEVRLKKGTKISFIVKNPMFSDAGLFSYLIKVYRDENDRIFNYVTALDNVNTTALTFKLTIGTDVFAEGDIKITDSSDDSIEFYLKSGNSSVAYFLKNTLMHQTEVWGNYKTGYKLEDSLNGCYPLYPTVSPPIGQEDGTVLNQFDFSAGEVIPRFWNDYPAVYVRHLVNSVIKGLGYLKKADAFNDNADFNRLAFFSPVYKKGEFSTTKISKHLPSVSILDFLKDIRTRFNIAVCFSPFLYEADIINIADAIAHTPDDWTSKFVKSSKAESVSEKQLFFTQKSENKTHLKTEEEIIESGWYKTVADFTELEKETNTGNYTSYTYFVESIQRWMKAEIHTPDSLTTQNPGCHFRLSTEDFLGKTYHKIVEAYLFDYTDTLTNSDTTVGALNLIGQFIFPVWEGSIDFSWGYNVDVKINSGEADLIVKLVGLKGDLDGDGEIDGNGGEYELGYDSVTISNTSYNDINRKLYTTGKFTLSETSRLALRFYCKSGITGSKITMIFGGVENGTGKTFESKGYINPQMIRWREVGMLSNYSYGNLQSGVKSVKVEPKSQIPVNELFQMDGFLFELPKSNLKKKDRDEMKDFEYIIYRGKYPDQQQGDKYAGYCNADLLDLEKEDYTNKLQAPLSPELSLAWLGEKGMLKQLWKNRLIWERYYKRAVEIKMELTTNDIINRKIYLPFCVNGVHYVTDELRFDMNEYGEINNTRIKAYTL